MLKNIRIRRGAIATPALGVLLAGVFSLGAGAPASAADVGIKARPTGCTYEVPGDWGGVARCTNPNGGAYRALVLCKDRETGKVYNYVGTWRQTGFSYAYCQGNTRATSAGIETRVSN
ncbi:hypothetical protein [Streptomyces sp900116325]|uniref:hypothetical protein n=1 Tax=Streptomyces sp. 900116325 TaxID=3154295 RepID=UPI0033A716F2